MRLGLLAIVVGSLVAAGFSLRSGRGDAEKVQSPEPVKLKKVELGSRVGGRVAAVHVQEGQLVQRGQVLVTFEAQELTARRDQAKGRLDAAQAALERADRGPLPEEIAVAKAAAEAASARLDRAQAGSREEQKRQAKGELDAALVEQTQADENFNRAEQLLSKGAVSKADYEAARAGRDRARLHTSVTRAAHDLTLNGRPEEIAEAKADFERAQAQYELLRRGTRDEDRAAAKAAVDLAQAQLAEAEAALLETVVTASELCFIEEVKVRPGSIVAGGQPVIVAH